MNTTVSSILEEITPLANETTKKIYLKQGIQEKILGINKGPLRKLALRIKTNHKIGLELWESNIFEARIIASMILDPLLLNLESIEILLDQTDSTMVIDELTFEVFETIQGQHLFMERWLAHPNLKLQI